MSRRADARNLSIQLTPDQYAALEEVANTQNKSVATYVRGLLANSTPGFDDSIQPRATLKNRKAGK